ncbi:MAG: GntR family transcriptional regulator [Gemmatimonadetes bacterium]|uniref:GntR family transcriptional regulator n=1 Tax=Boseongicola sp. SB0664_bin_43 TaxID=2604844 RepID=A0A6B0XY17_9RHOB|nr:GntR family transcriptional regulator [Boseongicola sp. SB0664_bin_43]MYG80427.1 GntR family transcriptional regulator [Gemmatimonadota bacterium]
MMTLPFCVVADVDQTRYANIMQHGIVSPQLPESLGMLESEESPVTKQGRRGALLVYEALRDDILWLRIEPGQAIDEVALARRFKTSRTPVREALLLLHGEWLVQFLPNRSTIVSPLTLNNAREYFDSHLVLARMAARAATLTGRADRGTMLSLHRDFERAMSDGACEQAFRTSLKLHRMLARLTGNIFLNRYFGHSLDAGMRAKILFYFPKLDSRERLRAGVLLEALIEAVISGDADAGDNAMKALVVHEIGVILRSLYPAFGDRMDLAMEEFPT